MLGARVARTVVVSAALNPFITYLWIWLNAAHVDVGAEIPSQFTVNLLSFGAESFVFQFVRFVCFWCNSPQWARASYFTRFLDHTQRRTAVGRTPLDEWSARRRDIYLTTHNTHNRQTSMPPAGFDTIISAGERPQTYALDLAATGTGVFQFFYPKI